MDELWRDMLRLGGPDGKLIGTCKMENTGGWQTWKTSSCEVSEAVGVQDLCLKFVGGEKPLLNLDHWKSKLLNWLRKILWLAL